jgi:hypothetical protein
MARSSVPPKVAAYVKRWVALFDARNWRGLQAHKGSASADVRYVQAQARPGVRAEVTKLGRYVPPRWPIMRTNDFVPTPEYWADIAFVEDGRQCNESYLAIAPRPDGKGWCSASLEPRPKPAKAAKPAPLDLDKESVRIGKTIAAAVKRFARRKDKRPVQAMVVSFSESQGTLTISFDLNPAYEPGELERMTHHGFEEVLVPRWAEADNATPARLGKMLVTRLLAMRDAGALEILRPAATGELGVDEDDGHFGWPAYAQRGRKNRLARARARARAR